MPDLTTFFMAIRVKEHLALNFGTACYIILKISKNLESFKRTVTHWH